MSADITPKKWFQALTLLVVGLALWLPRSRDLERYVTTDEVIWLMRSGNFYYALGQRDFAATDMNKSPGVVTMWVETLAFLKEFPQYRGYGQGMWDKYLAFERFMLSKGVYPHQILITGRLLMALLNVILLAAAFWFSRRLFGVWPALIGFLLIALEPYHVGITQLAHLDGPMSSFLFLCILAFLAYLLDGRRGADLMISAAAGGLAVLAKIPGWISAPTIGLLAVGAVFLWGEDHVAGHWGSSSKYVDGLLKPLLLWGAVFVIAISTFFPAMWVQPAATLKGLALSPLGFAEQAVTGANDEVAEEAKAQTSALPPATTTLAETQAAPGPRSRQTPGFILQDRFVSYLVRYPRGYFEHVSPVTLVGLLATLAAYLLRLDSFQENTSRRSLVGLFHFVVLYTVFMTIPPKSSDKYYIPVYPVFSLIAGTGIVAATRGFSERFRQPWKKIIFPAVIISLLLVQAAQSLGAHPYFLTYTNPLAGDPDAFAWGSGEGLDLAAEYLNQKPGIESMRAMSWYGIGPFSFYFKGETIPIFLGEAEWGEERVQQLAETDYLVTYANQWRRDLPPGLNEFLAGVEPEKRIWINNAEYARVYEVKKLPRSRLVLPDQPSP